MWPRDSSFCFSVWVYVSYIYICVYIYTRGVHQVSSVITSPLIFRDQVSP